MSDHDDTVPAPDTPPPPVGGVPWHPSQSAWSPTEPIWAPTAGPPPWSPSYQAPPPPWTPSPPDPTERIWAPGGPSYEAPPWPPHPAAQPYGGGSGWAPPPSWPPPPGGGYDGAWYPGWPGEGPAGSSRRKNRNAVVTAVVAMLVAALVGIGIGGQLVHRRSTVTSPPVSIPSLPPGTNPGTGSGGTGSGGTNPPSTNGATPSSGLSAADIDAIAAKVNPSVVDINTKLGYQRAAAAGTGMLLTSTGQVLTNNHVIEGSTSITVTVVSTGKTYPAKVVGTDPTADVAVIQLQGASGLTPIKQGDASKVKVGDPVVALGNAGGVGGPLSVVSGTVEALNQTITASDTGGRNAETLTGLIQISAPLQPGDSGGPLVNVAGEVIGMDTAASGSARFTSRSPVGFAIQIGNAVALAKEIAAGHASDTIHIGVPGFLGVQIQPATSGQSAVSGAVISGVIAATPAAGLGLGAGDVITAVDGQAVDSPDTLTTLTRKHKPGDKVTLTWTDTSGKSHKASVTLTTGPAD